jgi:hypothetical protein
MISKSRILGKGTISFKKKRRNLFKIKKNHKRKWKRTKMIKMTNAYVVKTSLILIGFNVQTKISVEGPAGIMFNVQELQPSLKTLTN